jgi:murein DD-endopeptidase MepM/ murein hydrolase activator NlpD
MANEFYTLIVVPHAKARFRKFQIPVSVVRRAKAGATVAGLVIGSLFAHYVYINLRALEVRRLRAENASLASRTVEYQRLTEGLKTRLSQLQSTVTKLGVMAGVEIGGSGPIAGVGGATSSEALAPTADLKAYIADLDKEMAALGARSARLETFYNDQKVMLASTPSTWPVRGYLSTAFGNRLDPFTGQPDFHSGIDISTPTGTPITAPADGTVIFVGVKSAYGNAVVVNHGYGTVTQYGHLDRFAVRPGQKLKRGDAIGYVGNTGRSTGPHLHYEIWVHDQARNPMQYIVDQNRNLG